MKICFSLKETTSLEAIRRVLDHQPITRSIGSYPELVLWKWMEVQSIGSLHSLSPHLSYVNGKKDIYIYILVHSPENERLEPEPKSE